MDWTEDSIVRLRAFWGEGLSTAEIGRRLNVSKNAVVGKAHRLSLPARPSPIRRGGCGAVPRPPSPRRVAGPTLPPLSSARPPAPRPAVAVPPSPVAAGIATLGPVRPVSQPRPAGRRLPCCWPIGEPGTSSFRFCDADATAGRPYCQEHAQLAYVRVRDRREDAA